jgi:hypothetical protein
LTLPGAVKMTNSKILLALIVTLTFLLAACGNNKPFNSTAWLKADARERGRMSEDLVKSKVLIGQAADEALRVLGRPDTSYQTALIYRIDMGMPFKDDPRHTALQVHLDGDRTVREVKIVD